MGEGAGGEITIEEQRVAEVLSVVAALQERAAMVDVSMSFSQCQGPGSRSIVELSNCVQSLANSLAAVFTSAHTYLAASAEAFREQDELIARNMANLGNG